MVVEKGRKLVGQTAARTALCLAVSMADGWEVLTVASTVLEMVDK